jgi:hypothetical protein
VFIQLTSYLVDGLIRYEDLMDDWWDVDAQRGMIRGQRTGQRIAIGDVADVYIVKVDLARRELNLAVKEIRSRGKGRAASDGSQPSKQPKPFSKHQPKHKNERRGGAARQDRQPGKKFRQPRRGRRR